MTRNWKSLLQESKGLLVAICISLFLHLFILGQSSLVVQKLDEEPSSLIEARLVVPALIKTTTDEVKVAKLPAPSKSPKPVQTPAPEETIQQAQESTVLPSEISTPEVPVAEPVIDTPQAIPEQLPEDAGLIDKPNPYQYVETDFDVRTDINAKVESSPAGRAKIIYRLIKSGKGYEISSLIQAQGLVALVIPDLLQKSKGYITDKGLRPIDYLYQFGDKKDKTYTAKFDWESNKLNMYSTKGNKQAVLVEGAQDLLSFMYQFMYVPPLQNMQIVITNGKKLDTYDYSFEGEEVLKTKMGDIKTMHLLRSSGDDEKDELWLALDYQYVPVKIRKTEKENKVYELLVTSINTEEPPVSSISIMQ